MVNNIIKRVAICGKQNTGKNTLANLLVQMLYDPYKNYKSLYFGNVPETKIIAFADPIKEMIQLMFPKADSKCLWGGSESRGNIIPDAIDKNGQPLTYRQALIDLGTLGRQYNPNMWVNVFDSRINNLYADSTSMIICPDVRFLNEYNYLKSNGFIIIKITRDAIFKSKDATETEQDIIKDNQFDFIIRNDSSIQELSKQIEPIIDLLK